MIPTLRATDYVDPDAYERERHAVFGREWQLAGFRAQLREPGDYVLHEVAGRPVVVVVQDDGSLRAFHNVCRHRAGPLVTDMVGNCTSLVCRYHGWAYGRDGALVSARDFGGEIENDEFGLFDVRVEEWRGFVFVNLDADARSLADDLGAFFAATEAHDLEQFTYSHRVETRLECNWKVYCDNYGEGYHIPLVHPGLNRELVAKEYRVDVGDRLCTHLAPTRAGAANAGLWVWRYPNLAVNVYAEGMDVERFLPAGPAGTIIVYDYFFADPDAAEANAAIEHMSLEVLDEDRIICEAVQRNLEAGVYEVGVLSPRHENGVAAFHEWLRASLGP
jgi:choline monooxygenase